MHNLFKKDRKTEVSETMGKADVEAKVYSLDIRELVSLFSEISSPRFRSRLLRDGRINCGLKNLAIVNIQNVTMQLERTCGLDYKSLYREFNIDLGTRHNVKSVLIDTICILPIPERSRMFK